MPGRGRIAGKSDGAGSGVAGDVGKGNVPPVNTAIAGDAIRFPAELDDRLASGQANNLDVAPADAVAQTRTQDLHDRFLGGEAGGQVLGETLRAATGVGNLVRGEATAQESLAVALDKLAQPGDLDDVNTVSHDGHIRMIRWS